MHIPKITVVSPTPNAVCFEKGTSRLHQKLTWGSKAEPRGAKPSRAACGRPRVIDSPITQNSFRTKKNVSPTQNASFSELHFLSCGQCLRYSILPRSCTLQLASRLRRTHVFAKLQFPTVASSTPNAHFANQVSSRLHQTRTILKK